MPCNAQRCITDPRKLPTPYRVSLQRPRTDGEKEKNDLDIFEETKSASLPAELKGEDTAALVVWDILRMGPITNASALSTDDEVGSLESGKEADPIAVLTNTP